MRRLLLALPLTLLPLVAAAQSDAHDHDHDHDEPAAQASLDAHAHGIAQLNMALDGQTLELVLESPAMNLVGFEYKPSSAADQAKVAAARSLLEQPVTLFSLNAGACSIDRQELQSPLFESASNAPQEHSEIHASYQFDCKNPHELKELNLSELFKQFPATTKVQVQLIGPNGQQGLELTPDNARLAF